MVEGEEKLSEKMSALAILACRPNSHPFQERHLTLLDPIKIGRSVARARPAANNCIFDCKVLSRHHAILWYENGSFFLQDTKSSNGTFVNNQRLCKGGEESPPREIFSNDLIQFGVEVMENNRRGEKITHGCIIATITLYHPDGREAKPDPYLNAPSIPGITIQSQDLYQLAHFLQEALHREKMLEQKLSSLQELVHNTQEASESGWQALIDEDKLLSRLEVLENQLHTYSKNHSEDALRQELVALQDEKLSYETTAKESLRRVLQEKLEAVTKLSDLERSLSNAENECAHLKHSCEQAQDELQELAVKYQDQLKEVAELTDRLAQAERAHEEAMSQQEKEKADLNDKIQQMVQQEAMLSAKIEAYQADNDFAKEQISAMKAKYESMKEINENEKIDELGPDINSCPVPEAEIIPLTDKDAGPENLEAKLKETQLQIEHYKAKLEESEAKLRESEEKVEQLQKELSQSKSESEEYLEKISSLEENIKKSDMHINKMMEKALDDMKLQLNESQKQCDGSNSLIVQLRARVDELEEELLSGTKAGDVTVQTAVPVASAAPHNGVSNHVAPSSPPSASTSFNDSQDLKDLLEQAQAAQKKAEMELAKSRDDLKETKAKAKKTTEEVLTMRSQLQESQRLAKERSDVIVDLQDQLKKAEGVTKDVKQQILDLREQLEAEKAKHKQTQADLSETKRHLQESQQNAKQSHNEAEQLKNKLKHLQEELDSERKDKRDSHTPSPSRHSHGGELYSGRMSSARNKEFQALKEECANLRKRIQAIEAEMKMSRRENLQLSSEYNKLQESYKQLEALKVKLDGTEPSGRPGLPPQVPRDSALALQEVSQSTEEVEGLQVQVKSYCQQLEQVRTQLADALSDYRALASRCKTVSMCSSIPLLLLLFAFLLVLYPTLAQLTATS